MDFDLQLTVHCSDMNRHEISSVAFNVQRSMETNALLNDLSSDVKNMFIVLQFLVCIFLIILLMVAALCCMLCSAPRMLSANGGRLHPPCPPGR